MKSPSTPPLPVSDGSRVTDAVRAQLLATEHWSLLATRSITWNEAFSRASMFLTVLSAAVVALALVAQATTFGPDFRLFAVVVLTIVLLLGLGTFIRLGTVNEQDFWLVVGMNRLRHAYLEMAPELEPYFVTGHHDDLLGIQQTYGAAARPLGIRSIVSSTPIVIGAIDAVVAGVLVALIAQMLGALVAVGIVAGGVGGVVMLLVLLWPPLSVVATQRRAYRPRFPVDGDGSSVANDF